jgi:hypothetical protein
MEFCFLFFLAWIAHELSKISKNTQPTAPSLKPDLNSLWMEKIAREGRQGVVIDR